MQILEKRSKMVVIVKVAQSCPSLRPCGPYSPWNSPGQNTGVGSLSLLQGIFPTQGLNPGLPHCRQILYQLSHKGSPVNKIVSQASVINTPLKISSAQFLCPVNLPFLYFFLEVCFKSSLFCKILNLVLSTYL